MRAHVTAEQQRKQVPRAPARAPLALPAAIGNRAFCELVALSRIQRAPVEPRTEVTAFGTFEVHPDGEELPVAEAGAGHVWPISEALFARLQVSMAAIAGNEGALRVTGSRSRSREQFLPVILLDFAWLQTQPLGADLIAAILATGHVAHIIETPGLNRTVYGDPDAACKPDVGSDVRIDYDPALEVLGDGSAAWMHRPPAIGLAHELVHAWTGMTGIRAPTEEASERQAEGVGEFSDTRFTENRFRKAFGLDPRTP
jgi:hypothetical protein